MFPEALKAVTEGFAISRLSWHAKRFIVLVPGSTIQIESHRPLGQALPRLVGQYVDYMPHLDVLTIHNNGTLFTLSPWQVDTADIVGAEDWYVVKPDPEQLAGFVPAAQCDCDFVENVGDHHRPRCALVLAGVVRY